MPVWIQQFFFHFKYSVSRVSFKIRRTCIILPLKEAELMCDCLTHVHYNLKMYVTASICLSIRWKSPCGKQKWNSFIFLVLWYWERLLLKQRWWYIRKDSDSTDLQYKISFASRVNKLNLLLLVCLSCLLTEIYEWNYDLSFVTLPSDHKILLIFKYILFIPVLCCVVGVW